MDKPLSECIKVEHVCKIDGEKFETEKQLHMHLRKHKMRMAEYYQKYYPRRDLLTGDLIKFKNKAHYFANYFNSRPNMKKYLESASQEDARKFWEKRTGEENKPSIIPIWNPKTNRYDWVEG